VSDQEQMFDGLHVEYYRGIDGGRGHPLLFVHGAWGGSWMFKNYLSYLPAAGWNCYAMNLRGHYKSASAQLAGITQWDYARDVVRIARRLPAPPVLIGFGTGAHLIQLALSRRFPAIAAIFVSAKLPNRQREPIPDNVFKMPHLLPAEPIAPASDILPETLAWMNTQMADAVEPRSALVALLNGDVQTAPDFVEVPYLVVNGGLDDTISPLEGAELANFYKGGGTLDVVPGVSHEGILVGLDWREGANAIHSWLMTNGLDTLRPVGNA
jgi:pimeloyl-ACP methyl ester carboxylesterase